MISRHLKKARVVIAIIFLVLTSILFLDFRDAGIRYLSDEVLYLQFVPSVIKFLTEFSLGAAGFILVLCTTLLFGRVYCSFVCPLGGLQDLISRLSGIKTFRAGKKRRRYSVLKPHKYLRYAILILTVLFFVGGSGLLLNFLDPFSSFGRILSNIFRPMLLALNNILVPLTELSGYSGVYHVRGQPITLFSFGVAFVTLLGVGWASAVHGRLYCNSICPVGTLLGLVAKHSMFRIQISPAECRGCGSCEHVCKAGCLDVKDKSIDLSRCVSCYNCLSSCPDHALRFSVGSIKDLRKNPPSGGRRKFITVFAAMGLSLTSGKGEAEQPAKIIQSRPTTIPETRTGPISPPGSGSVGKFISKCTACHLCVSICPSRVLEPSFLEYDLNGIMMPRMVFHSGHCNFDCTICSEVCPSGAILPLGKEHKRETQVGVARFIRENCVVFTDNTNCGACSEHCPTKAVHMVSYPNDAGRKLVIPKVDESLCVGCGGCEHACPTRPYKAIYVNGNPVHKLARKPEDKPLESNADDSDEFPF